MTAATTGRWDDLGVALELQRLQDRRTRDQLQARIPRLLWRHVVRVSRGGRGRGGSCVVGVGSDLTSGVRWYGRRPAVGDRVLVEFPPPGGTKRIVAIDREEPTSDWGARSILDEGGIGDGTADDTAAFLAAWEAGGGRVVLPAGTWSINSVAFRDGTGIVITGPAGASATILRLRGGSNSRDLVAFSGCTGIRISGITFDGDRTNNVTDIVNDGNALAFYSCDDVVLHDVRCTEARGNGLMTFGGEDHRWTSCRFDHNRQNGTYHTTTSVAIDDGLVHLTANGCIADNNGTDGFCSDPGSTHHAYAGCIAPYNGGVGFTVYGNASGIGAGMVTYSSCIAHHNQLEGFGPVGGHTVIYSGCISFEDGQVGDPTPGAIPRHNGWIILENASGQVKTTRIVLIGCHIIRPKGNGIYIDSTTAQKVGWVQIVGGSIEDVGAGGSGLWSGIHADDVDHLDVDIAIRDTRDTQRMLRPITLGPGVVDHEIRARRLLAGLLGDLVGGQDEIQKVAITGAPTGGTFTLTFGGQTTGTIAHNASAATLQAALEALSNTTPGDVAVAGSLPSGIFVTFKGAHAATDVGQMTANGAGLTGGTSPAVAISTWRPGGSPLGGAGYATEYILADTGSGVARHRIRVGAPDSAGTGLRALAIEN